MTRFEPSDTVHFASKGDWIIGEVEDDEVTKGPSTQGGPWSGDRYIVLSSCSEKLATSSGRLRVAHGKGWRQ